MRGKTRTHLGTWARPGLAQGRRVAEFPPGHRAAGSWLPSLSDQLLAVLNSALVDSALDQTNGFLFNECGGGVSLGADTEAKWHLLTLIFQSLLLVYWQASEFRKIYESKIMGTVPGRPSLSIKRTALTKSSVVSFLFHFRPCSYSQGNTGRKSSWDKNVRASNMLLVILTCPWLRVLVGWGLVVGGYWIFYISVLFI